MMNFFNLKLKSDKSVIMKAIWIRKMRVEWNIKLSNAVGSLSVALFKKKTVPLAISIKTFGGEIFA